MLQPHYACRHMSDDIIRRCRFFERHAAGAASRRFERRGARFGEFTAIERWRVLLLFQVIACLREKRRLRQVIERQRCDRFFIDYGIDCDAHHLSLV